MASPHTLYNERYCLMLIEHMSNGFSFESFAWLTEPRVKKETLHAWASVHPDFSFAKDVAYSGCLYFWESLGIMGASGETDSKFNVTAWIYNMKCRFGGEWLEDNRENNKPLEYREPLTLVRTDPKSEAS